MLAARLSLLVLLEFLSGKLVTVGEDLLKFWGFVGTPIYQFFLKIYTCRPEEVTRSHYAWL